MDGMKVVNYNKESVFGSWIDDGAMNGKYIEETVKLAYHIGT
jgi:hypothetical protein